MTEAVLAALQMLPGGASGEAPGWAWVSDSVTYAVDGNAPATAGQLSVPAAAISAHDSGHASTSPWATFALIGNFAEAAAPYIGDCRLECTGADGWGPGFTLGFTARGMPTAVGDADDPRLRFLCKADVWATSGAGCGVGFVVEVDRRAALAVVSYEFEHGSATVVTVPFFQLHLETD